MRSPSICFPSLCFIRDARISILKGNTHWGLRKEGTEELVAETQLNRQIVKSSVQHQHGPVAGGSFKYCLVYSSKFPKWSRQFSLAEAPI